jgi:hypothetical protein
MKTITLILVLCCTGLDLHCQEFSLEEPIFPRCNIGLGGGIDYGGFGGRISILTSQKLEFFGAIGYNLLGIGLNGGVDWRILPQSRICPYFGAMYGYNAVIKVKGAEMYNKTYYGPSWNLGLEFWSRRNKSFFNFELIVPIRSSEYHKDIKDLKNNQNITFSNVPLPFGISIGYHFSL